MNNKFRNIVIFVLCINILGCSTLREKFVRKKEPEEVKPIVNIEEYSNKINTKELYKKHFVFWKYWHEELINVLGGNKKKQKQCYNEILAELKAMASYLQQQKAEILQGYIKEIEELENDVNSPVLSQVEVHRIKIALKQYKRIIDNEFSLYKVKDWILESQ